MSTESMFPNEEAAEYKTGISGWVCKNCRRFYGEEERVARYCCEKDHACDTDGCAGRAEKSYIYCDPCNKKRDLERWLAFKEVEWDGKTPLCLDDGDHFFFSPEELDEYLEEEGLDVKDVRIVVCEECEPPSFEMYDFLQDHLAEGMEAEAHWADIDKKVNDWIKENVPTVWFGGKTRPSAASVAAHLDTEIKS